MHFGTYLIEKEAITEEQLIEALIYQLDHLPSLLSILYEHKVFDTKKLLSIISLQIKERADIYTVIKKHQFLSNDDVVRVLKLQHKKRVPLGQILVERKSLELAEAQTFLNDFLVRQSEMPEEKEEEKREEALPLALHEGEERNNGHRGGETHWEIPDFTDQLEECPVEKPMVKEFLQMFDEGKKDEMEMAVLSWSKLFKEEMKSELRDSLRDFYRELHTIKGTARFLKAHLSEFVVHNLEELLSSVQELLSELDVEDCEKVESIYLKGTDILWDLRNELQANSSEKSLWKIDEWRENMLTLVKEAFEYRQELDEREVRMSEEDFSEQF